MPVWCRLWAACTFRSANVGRIVKRTFFFDLKQQNYLGSGIFWWPASFFFAGGPRRGFRRCGDKPAGEPGAFMVLGPAVWLAVPKGPALGQAWTAVQANDAAPFDQCGKAIGK